MNLDGAGTIKIETLDEAMSQTQRLYAAVERMAIAVRSQQDTAPYVSQFRRTASPLVGLLKPQFGLIADQVSSLLLTATRGGGGEQTRLRNLREGVAQLRTQLELAVVRTKDKHEIRDEKPKTSESNGAEA